MLKSSIGGYMIIGLSLALMLIIAGIMILISRRKADRKEVAEKVISVLCFAVYIVVMLCQDAIDDVIGNTGVVTGIALVWVIILRWFTVAAAVLIPVSAWFRYKTFDNIIAIVFSASVLLNVCFFDLNMLAAVGSADYTTGEVRAWIYGLLFALQGGVCIYRLYDRIKRRKEYPGWREQLKGVFSVLPMLLTAVFPQYAFQALFGYVELHSVDFSVAHRIFIYIAVLTPILVTIIFKNREERIRRAVVCTMAISAFVQYFYVFTFESFTTPTGLPFHLCNTAILLMVMAYVFKMKGVFYFTYFVNVVGALFAILLPNNGENDLFSLNNFHFWYNHWNAFFLPILGITLKIYPRPNFKMIRKAIAVFTVYIVLMVVLNGWLQNYDPNVDYFFLNRNFIVDKFGSTFIPLKESFVLRFPLGGNLEFKTYWLYDLVVYVVYIGFIFVTWAIYAYSYRVSDHYAEAAMLLKLDTLEIMKLKKEMGDRPISQPVDPSGVDMIKIEHFSKRYGKSDRFAVKDFNLEVYDGEVFGFLGHNGAGKSTTIKSLVGIQSITEGRMEVCGYDVARQPLEAKKCIGYVSDNHAVYEHLTGREYINYIADLYEVPAAERKERIEKFSTMFKLESDLDREIKGYSHGMKQKVMVISTLIHNPKVWILDEPLTGLDPTSAYQIKECMKMHAEAGNIVFFSSHVIEVVEKVCTRIAIISHGELKGVYDVAQLKKEGVSMEDLYMSYIQ